MMLVTGPSLRDWRASIGMRPSLLSETGARILPQEREVLQQIQPMGEVAPYIGTPLNED
jgi:hypothetical protein